jgi:putative ribosome biogenesis GTPase RsgA
LGILVGLVGTGKSTVYNKLQRIGSADGLTTPKYKLIDTPGITAVANKVINLEEVYKALTNKFHQIFLFVKYDRISVVQ